MKKIEIERDCLIELGFGKTAFLEQGKTIYICDEGEKLYTPNQLEEEVQRRLKFVRELQKYEVK